MTVINAIRNKPGKGLVLGLLFCASQAAAEPPVADIGGAWDYIETSLLVLKPEDETIHVSCFLPDGEIVINQVGSTFTGTLTHYSTTCLKKDGTPLPAPWQLPYQAFFSGHLSGTSLHIDQYDAPPEPPIHCPKQGFIELEEGIAVAFSTTGRCDLSEFPFPFMAKNRGEAVRP